MYAPGTGRLIERALAASAAGMPLGPDAATLLARAYAHSGDETIGDVLGMVLAQALRDAAEPASWRPVPSEGRTDWTAERAAWLGLFVDVAAISDDTRIGKTITTVTHAVIAGWPAAAAPAARMREIETALRAALSVEPRIASRIVDELERGIAHAYRPGSGLIVGSECAPGTLDDYAQTAAALLTAYGATGRLPYAMLADDLVQFARSQWWAAAVPVPARARDVAAFCTACRVLARLSAVHADPGYAEAAVTTGYRHLQDADRLLQALAPAAEALGLEACAHALAAEEVRAIAKSKGEQGDREIED